MGSLRNFAKIDAPIFFVFLKPGFKLIQIHVDWNRVQLTNQFLNRGLNRYAGLLGQILQKMAKI